jgi:hypothetical protein
LRVGLEGQPGANQRQIARAVTTQMAPLAPWREERPTGWFVVNVVAPLLLPVFAIFLFSLAPLPPPMNVHVMAMLKDGQIGWAVVAMGASTMYEWVDAAEAHRNLPALSGVLIFGTIAAMLGAILVAVGGAVFSTLLRPKPPPVKGLVAWLAYYRMFFWSAVMAFYAGLTYTYIHFSLLP